MQGGDGSDFKLDDESLELSFGSSADLLEDSSSGSGDSDVLDAVPDELSFGSSDIALAAGSSDENVLGDDEPSEKGRHTFSSDA